MNQEERALESRLAVRLLEAEATSRESAYRQVYEDLHAYLQTEASRKTFLYRRRPSRFENRSMAPHKTIRDLVDRFVPRWLAPLSEIQLVGHGRDVLEVGCGEGWLSIMLAIRNRSVTGIDISDRCIELCRRNQDVAQVNNVSFIRQNGVVVAFPDATFDSAISTEFVEHLHPDDVLPHLVEIRRVLRPGGRYIVVTPNGYRHGAEAEGTLHLHVYTYDELARLFFRAGFKRVLSPLLKTNVLVSVYHKVRLERVFHRYGLRHGWGGMGLSSVILCGIKAAEEVENDRLP
jgi:SAM-dependent methyltransferase